MQRHRRQTPAEHKRGIEALDNVSEIKGLVEVHLKHRQLKADLELMRLENKLHKQIRWLQTRRLDQLNEK
jgi:hypothetical protein